VYFNVTNNLMLPKFIITNSMGEVVKEIFIISDEEIVERKGELLA
jgi:hypothetical protein